MDLAANTEEPASALDRAMASLRRLIVQGQLGGGQPLIETDLALRLGAARSTVREALRSLQAEGLLVARRRGLQVRRLAHADVADLYDVREALEGLAARRAAERMAASDPALRERFARERAIWSGAGSTFRVAAFSAQNRRLHEMLVAAAGNTHLPRMLDQTLMALFASQFRAWVDEGAMATAAAEHCNLVDALLSGAPAAAERATRRHVRSSASIILALPEAAFD